MDILAAWNVFESVHELATQKTCHLQTEAQMMPESFSLYSLESFISLLVCHLFFLIIEKIGLEALCHLLDDAEDLTQLCMKVILRVLDKCCNYRALSVLHWFWMLV